MSTILGKYKIVRSLGSGGFATVFLVRDPNQNQWAIKLIDKKKIVANGMEKYIQNEIKVMGQISSDYIVKLSQYRQDEKYFYLVLEYCNGRDLKRQKGQKQNKVFTLEEATYILSQVLKGLQVIHRKGYLHRDIKLQNVLVKIENGHKMYKIADFGFTKPQNISETVVGTPTYMSPEIFQNQKYGFEVDMWALGVMFYMMLNKNQPFQINASLLTENYDIAYEELVKQAKDFSYKNSIEKSLSKFKQNCTPQVQDLFKRIFEVDPKKRMTFVEIRSHPLFKKYFPAQINQQVATIIKMNKVARQPPNLLQKKQKKDQQQEDISPKLGLNIEIHQNEEFSKQKHYLFHKNQQIQFLYDNYSEIDHSHGLLTHIQKMMLCFNLVKYYIILKRNFLEQINKESIENQKGAYNFKDYFKTNDFKEQYKQFTEQLQRATSEYSQLYQVCSKNLQIIGKNNPSFVQAFHQQIQEKQFSDTFKASYRKSTTIAFGKLRKFLGTDSNKGNSCNYYLTLVVISHVFNRIFTEKQKLSKAFKDFMEHQNNQADNLDYCKLREWMSKATPLQLNAVTKNIMTTYF